MSKYPKKVSKNLEKSSKCIEISRIFVLKIMNPIGQNFPQRDVKSMSEIVYTGIMEIKQLSKQHGCKV